MSDVLDILEVERPVSPEVLSKESIFGNDSKKKKKKILETNFKRPEGMHRELFALLYSDGKRDAAPVFDSSASQGGYKQKKANFGPQKVRKWKWMSFNNPARMDGLALHHWRRIADEGKEYAFAKFNKNVQVPSYSDAEYSQYLECQSWSKEETNHLFDLCQRFDLRFVIIQDRWDFQKYQKRSVEDLKERYHYVCDQLLKARVSPGQETKSRIYDADHERRRKEQMEKLYNRTPEQIEEEQMLLNELRKIEMRKKEREKKTQDLQKLITAADNSTEVKRAEKKGPKKKVSSQKSSKSDAISVETAGIKFPDFKGSGVTLRSQRMKLPTTVGQKKIKAIEQLLLELGLDLNPIPCEEICPAFNEIRSDMVLLYELKLVLANCEFDAQALSHQYEAMAGKPLDSGTLYTLGISNAQLEHLRSPDKESKSADTEESKLII